MKRLIPIIILALMALGSMNLYGQYCDAYTSNCDEYISRVQLGDIDNESDCTSGNQADYTDISTNLIAGSEYTLTVTNGVTWYSTDQCGAWIDWNQDGDFNDANETISPKTGTGPYSLTFTVPKTAASGETRMRVRIVYSTTPQACGTSSWGETEDYTVNIMPPPPDAALTAYTSPEEPFSVGNYNVVVTLENKEDVELTSCEIQWNVNNETQPTQYWEGSLGKGESEDVVLGSYNFNYPLDEEEFNAFRIWAKVSNQNGLTGDASAGNDILVAHVAPTLNDAGATAMFGPDEGFGPGETKVRARIQNYAPKPLTSVTVRWSVDGEEQSPFTAEDIYVPNGGSTVIEIGTYDFQAKTPLAPYDVECWTVNPNGVSDENTDNDKYTGGMGPSLVAGTYTIGGTGSHFDKVSTALSYLNSSGIFGGGQVVLNVNRGTYDGQFEFSKDLGEGSSLILTSATGNAGDVTITYSPTNSSNYVGKFSGATNVTIRNLTFKNTAPVANFAGTILNIEYSSNINIHDCLFIGTESAPRNLAYSSLRLMNNHQLYIHDNNFYYGGVGIYNESDGGMIEIKGNRILNVSYAGIYNMGNGWTNVDIMNNKLLNYSAPMPTFGIYSQNGTNIRDNEITGITGNGADSREAAIAIIHNNSNETAEIYHNNIHDCSNVNGIYVEGADVKINRNMIHVENTMYPAYALVSANNNASGYVANNMMPGTGMYGIELMNSNVAVMYNTVGINSMMPVAMVNGNTGPIMRNIFANMGSGYAAEYHSMSAYDENNYMAYSGNIIWAGGNTYTDMESYKMAMMNDANSVSEMIEFVSPTDLSILNYNAALLLNDPVPGLGGGWQQEIEGMDYKGQARKSFYIGADEIELIVNIEQQPRELVICNGESGVIDVTATINYNADIYYQWEKDGMDVPGATEPVLEFTNINHTHSGTYICRIFGPGATNPEYSEPAAVYVLAPTEILEQPTNILAFEGERTTLHFEAHVNGVPVDEAIINRDVKVQWYKDNEMLNDNAMVAGSKSNYLTIRNMTQDYAGDYYAVVTGKCGEVQTGLITVQVGAPNIMITEQPTNLDLCQGEDAIFAAVAESNTGGDILYQWYKDGAEITDVAGEIMGTQSHHLTIYGIDDADAGTYWCMATVDGMEITANSEQVDLMVGMPPAIREMPSPTIELYSGEDLELTVNLEAPQTGLNFIVTKDGNELVNETFDTETQSYTYSLTGVVTDDAGKYEIIVTNGCGMATTGEIDVLITDPPLSVNEQYANGYVLYSPVPNPATSEAVVEFSVPSAGNATMELSDAEGRFVGKLFEGMTVEGTNSVKINTTNLESGVYFYTLRAQGIVLTGKLTVIK